MDLLNLEPKAIWKNFSALNSVPRPSKKEEKVIAFIKSFGESLNLDTYVDKTGNVIIRKPATPGMEDRKMIVLQSHLDMVCQKNNDTVFDFETQGIEMYVDGDWVRAKGTTLGADNGLGVATIMSILESNDIPHPALEALFTIDEETGMTGAFGLEEGTLQGEILLNLDTEEDDEIDIGCAGGVDVSAYHSYATQSFTGKAICVSIKGLKGGHSGMDIIKGRGNANVLLSRFLFVGLSQQLQLLSIQSGGLRNAIPREGTAYFTVNNSAEYLKLAEVLKSEILNEYKSIEKEININISEVETEQNAISIEDSASLIKSLKAAHNGVYRMSPDVEGLVEASNNIAKVVLDNGELKILNLTRSSVESTKMEVAEQLRAAFELGGMRVKFTGSYPGWQPNPHSEIVEILENIYTRKFGDKPNVVACHAGLECGLIGAHYPKMEMVSFGPTIKGAHSPEERASIASTQKFWSFLQDILKEIPKK
ncbi:aminoacyl-histidine dipeptidase [Elizabethkingia sp. JS20170427COW]|uniref:aminoacyl-histidine dipeptidase n=1 Tax=Elizabethkingia sp. JS20170427COW TaxID=2583851 RepID=UPI00111023AB|nr:aminoacyl-histidine dipeptidase [Elizabethkingia sp. JS20170427COW]QCX52612.1 aminoacyl-histidine dipeptidase [Elizabethkingia sp. JS20170427COW]